MYILLQQSTENISVVQLAAVSDLNAVPQLTLGIELDAGDVDDSLGVEGAASDLGVIGAGTGSGIRCSLEVVGAVKICAGIHIAGNVGGDFHLGKQGALEPKDMVVVIHYLIPLCAIDSEALPSTANQRVVCVCVRQTIA